VRQKQIREASLDEHLGEPTIASVMIYEWRRSEANTSVASPVALGFTTM
jgi:hypothetical protein